MCAGVERIGFECVGFECAGVECAVGGTGNLCLDGML